MERSGSDQSQSQSPLGRLTPRQRAVAALAADGFTNHEIAARLYISENTIEYHLKTIFARLGIHRRGDLIRLGTEGSTKPSRGVG